MNILSLTEIESLLPHIDLVAEIENGFVAYSRGQAVVPPVGELLLEKGEAHIKYGYLKDHPYYVIKIASGFYDNPQLGLSSSNGLMLLFCQQTGQLQCILLDEGHLTDARTAVAGAVTAKYLAPSPISKIGIMGTGIQAKRQLEFLYETTDCREVLVWGRSQQKLTSYVEFFRSQTRWSDLHIATTQDARDVAQQCNLIVTTTPAHTPLLEVAWIRPGTHITAVGSDTPDKQELDAMILKQADVVVADSVAQCAQRGEIYQAIRTQNLDMKNVVELGDVIDGRAPRRATQSEITVADLTGVAVQDIQIATAVFRQSDLGTNPKVFDS